MEVHTCKICGKKFRTLRSNKKCCSPKCSAENNRRCARQRGRANSKNVSRETFLLFAPKICIVCGKSFVPNKYSPNSQTCSTECGNKRHNEQNRLLCLRRKNVSRETKECVICGKSFTPSFYARAQKTCSPECGKKLQAMGQSHRRLFKPCQETFHSTLDETIRRAEKCGLSYGQYTALITLGKTHEEILNETAPERISKAAESRGLKDVTKWQHI